MADHFAAFSFVDRITELDPGRSARGRYVVPAGLAHFPPSLVAEAIGQLAAWASMSHIDFRARPVAGLATETRFYADAPPGSTIELAVELERCDDEAVAYSGHARVGGETINELIDALGPMLPAEEFDSTSELRARFELLRGAGAAPGAFRGVEPPRLEAHSEVPGVSATATLQIPDRAPFFGDHFPRRPVFPATLLIDAQIGHAMGVARKATHWRAGTAPRPSKMTHIKMRTFMPPGTPLAIEAALSPEGDEQATIMLSARMDGKIASTSRLEVVAAARSGNAEDER